jgi:PqqD family protein of HPr-rel-A system
MARYRQNPRTAGRTIDGLAFVVTPDDNKLHTLNATGTLIWELAEKPASLDEIAAALAARFDVDADRARADASAFLADLLARQIIVQDGVVR